MRAMAFDDVKGLLAAGVNETSAAAFAKDLAARVPLGSNLRAGEEYRRLVCEALVRRGPCTDGGVLRWKSKLNLTAGPLRRRPIPIPCCWILSVRRAASASSGAAIPANCGLCTVLLDGVPVLSSSVLAARADGHSVQTPGRPAE